MHVETQYADAERTNGSLSLRSLQTLTVRVVLCSKRPVSLDDANTEESRESLNLCQMMLKSSDEERGKNLRRSHYGEQQKPSVHHDYFTTAEVESTEHHHILRTVLLTVTCSSDKAILAIVYILYIEPHRDLEIAHLRQQQSPSTVQEIRYPQQDVFPVQNDVYQHSNQWKP